MTRKRFIKLLMSSGMSRNHANLYAIRCRARGISYAERYEAMRLWLGLNKGAMQPTVTMRMAAGAFKSGLARAIAAANKLAEILQDCKTVQPFTCRDESTGGDYGVEIAGRHFMDGEKCVLTTVDEVHTWDPVRSGANACIGIDLAHGPDFTGWQPIIRPDTVVINMEPVMPRQNGTMDDIIREIEKGLRK